MKKLFKVDTDKEAFELVSEHLLKQNAKCRDEDGCYYDGDQFGLPGEKCAIGALLTDDGLSDFGSFMGGVETMLGSSQLYHLKYDSVNLNVEMLKDLQRVHDNAHVLIWPERLQVIKRRYNLGE